MCAKRVFLLAQALGAVQSGLGGESLTLSTGTCQKLKQLCENRIFWQTVGLAPACFSWSFSEEHLQKLREHTNVNSVTTSAVLE